MDERIIDRPVMEAGTKCFMCLDPDISGLMHARDWSSEPFQDYYFCTVMCRQNFLQANPHVKKDRPEHIKYR